MRLKWILLMICLGCTGVVLGFLNPESMYEMLPRLHPTQVKQTQAGRLIVEQDPIILEAQSTDHSDNSNKIETSFRVTNPGPTPVVIRSVRSSCGCAVLRVTPNIIGPGEDGVVDIAATMPELGEKIVTVNLLTDSPDTPDVELRLIMRGARKPPYLARAGGDLTYIGGWSPSDERELIVTTTEPPDSRNPPQVKCDLPFLQFTLADVKESLTTDRSAVARFYHYRVTFSSNPPPGRFRGEVVVIDPWDPSNIERVPVYGEPREIIVPIPRRLILDVQGPGDKTEVPLRVLCRDPVQDLTVEPEDGSASPLHVKAIPSADGEPLAFTVRLRSDARHVPEGIYNLVIRTSSSSDQLSVPVMIRRSGL